MQDRFEHYALGYTSPATRAVAVEPSDDALPFVPRAIFVGEGGDLATRSTDGEDVVWKNVQTGTILPFRATMILEEGTTAANLLVLD